MHGHGSCACRSFPQHADDVTPVVSSSKPTFNIRMTAGLMELLCDMVAGVKGGKVTLKWGEPDAEGFYTPSITMLYE